MNHFIGLPSLSLFLIILFLLWLWRWYMEQRRQLPGLIRAWRDSLGLSQEAAAERLSELLREKYPKRPKYIDPRTFQRWESGEGLPHLETFFMVKQTLSGTPYTQIEQTLPDGTKSYAAMGRTDELTSDDLERLIYESHEGSYKKGLISEEDWRAYQKRYDAIYKPNGQKQPTRKRSRSRKKRHSK